MQKKEPEQYAYGCSIVTIKNEIDNYEKKSIKSAFAIACVAVASVSGVKAYNASNHSEADLLLLENVEALSDPEIKIPCYASSGICTFNAVDANNMPGKLSLPGVVHI